MPTHSEPAGGEPAVHPCGRGFTLIEVAVVLALLGIAMAVSAPALARTGSRDTQAAAAIVLALDRGRAHAARSGATATVTINRASGSARTTLRRAPGAADSLVAEEPIPAMAGSSLASQGSDSLVVARFDPRGRASATPFSWPARRGRARLLVDPWTGAVAIAWR